ncbi:MAG: hypothetical protein LBR26_11075 [Prevotella sp.]|jgi:hypothetical protein|nr:hypothetical protein [Prevotella sp.]
MNTGNRDKLRDLFREVKPDQPSAGFESRLMQQIHIVAAKQTKKRSLISTLSITGGIVGMLGIPSLVFRIFGSIFKTELKPVEIDFAFAMPEMKFDPFIISIACVVLLLLIGDTLIRRHIREKKHKD